MNTEPSTVTPSPLVSVIIPAYNAEEYFEETLESLLVQSLTNWEAIIIDDGSTDSTLALAQSYAQRDARIQVVQQANAGVSQARNLAIARSKGEFIAFLDSDDIWLPEKLQTQVEAMRAHDVALVYCPFREFGENCFPWCAKAWGRFTDVLDSEEFWRKLLLGCFVIPSCVLVRTDVLRGLGGFDLARPRAEDYDLWFRIARAGYKVFGQDTRLCLYRKRGDSLSRESEKIFFDSLEIVSRNLPKDCLHWNEFRDSMRGRFRNTFTEQGDLGRFEQLGRMFDVFFPFDRDGKASRFMSILRTLLPVRVFWFVCRYAVIPLAWHIESVPGRLAKLKEGFLGVRRGAG